MVELEEITERQQQNQGISYEWKLYSKVYSAIPLAQLYLTQKSSFSKSLFFLKVE